MMSIKTELSIVSGLFMAFLFMSNSLLKEEINTTEEIQTIIIAVVATGIVSGLGLYLFVKNSQVNKICGKGKGK